ARGTVHGADDGDVVAGAVAEVVRLVRAAVEAHEGAVIGGRRQRGRHLRSERIIALERTELHVVDVDVFADGDGPAGEADDLAVFGNGVAFLDRPHGELVPHLDGRGQLDGAAIEEQLRAGGDG